MTPTEILAKRHQKQADARANERAKIVDRLTLITTYLRSLESSAVLRTLQLHFIDSARTRLESVIEFARE